MTVGDFGRANCSVTFARWPSNGSPVGIAGLCSRWPLTSRSARPDLHGTQAAARILAMMCAPTSKTLLATPDSVARALWLAELARMRAALGGPANVVRVPDAIWNKRFLLRGLEDWEASDIVVDELVEQLD